MTHVVLDLWGDVMDPWSYVAKRRVEAAIAASERPADVVLLHRARSGGSVSEEELLEAATAARPDGIDIAVSRAPQGDAHDAHRLVALGLEMGGPALQAAMLERLYAAVFTEGLDVSSTPVLQRIAAEAGLDERRVAAVLASTEFADDVAGDEATARRLGITAPHLVADHRLGLGGRAAVEDYVLLIDGSLGGHPAVL